MTLLAAMLVAVSAASSAVAARQRMQTTPVEPGMPTVPRMYIMNAGANEAVPVTIQNGSDIQPVAVMSLPTVTLSPGTTVAVHAARQPWEYRQITIAASDDAASALSTAGAEGWEAVSSTSTSRGVQVLMKRPR
jgi:hypothetical protein